MSKRYQVYKDVNGKYRFRLRADDDQIVAVGQAYGQHGSCLKSIMSIQANCRVGVEDLTVEEERISNPKYQVFYDENLGFRFRLNAANGKTIAISEGYDRKEGCLEGIEAVKKSCDAGVEDLTLTQKQLEEIISYDAFAREFELLEGEVEESPADMVHSFEPPSSRFVVPVVTGLELQNVERVKDGEVVVFQGRLFSRDSGKGVAGGKIGIYERDRSLLGDDYLAYGSTGEDGFFRIEWRARPLTWFEKSGTVYAVFKGNERANPSKSALTAITIE